jgi:hypothetical protein
LYFAPQLGQLNGIGSELRMVVCMADARFVDKKPPPHGRRSGGGGGSR